MFDDTGELAYGSGHGDGPVFLLAKTWAGVPQERHVVIPSGKALYVPVMDSGKVGRYPGRSAVDCFLAVLPAK